MSLKPDNTDKAAGKVVRSHLSQAYTNAKEGVFVSEDTAIEPTRLEEPSVLISKSQVQLDPTPGTLISPTGTVQLGSVKITSETIKDLESMLDVRELEQWTDGWLGAGTGYTIPSSQFEQLSDIINSCTEEIDEVRNFLNKRSKFINAIQTYVINSQRRKILESREVNSSATINNKTPTYADHGRIFSPHCHAILSYQTKLTYLELGFLNADNFESVDLGVNLDLTTILTNQTELDVLFAHKGKLGVKLNNEYHSTSIILGLIDWVTSTIDHGFTPNYFIENSTSKLQIGGYSFDNRLRMPDGVIPRLNDIGLYKETRDNGVADAIEDQLGGLILGPNGLPLPQGTQYNNLSKPNLKLGHEKNPAIRVMSNFERMSNYAGNTNYFGASQLSANVMTIAHMCAMLRSESLQSSKIENFNSDFLPDIQSRITEPFPGFTVIKGIGKTLLGSNQEDPLRGSDPEQLSNIVSDEYQGTPYLPFEKGLEGNGRADGNLDLYDIWLKEALDPKTDESTRREIIDNIESVYKDKLEKVVGATADITRFFSGQDGSDKWIINNLVPTSLPGQSANQHPGGGPAQFFGHIISNPVVKVAEIFRRNEEDTCTAFPFDYWASSNLEGIQSDRETIAQITGLIATAKKGALDPRRREDLRSTIVEALVNRDLKTSKNYVAFGTQRTVGYYKSISKVQNARIADNVENVFEASFTAEQAKTIDDFIYNTPIQTLEPSYFSDGVVEGQNFSAEQLFDLAIAQFPANQGNEIFSALNLNGAGFFFEEGVSPLQATDEYIQGNEHRDYRITKFNQTYKFMSAILGQKNSTRDDLYTMILADVDELDRSLSSNPSNSPGNFANHVDGTFGVTGDIDLLPGNYHGFSGLTKAHAFDRTTLISFVVDMYARTLNDVFTFKMGTSGQGNVHVNQLNTGQMRNMPLVVEVYLRDSLALSRDRMSTYFKNIFNPGSDFEQTTFSSIGDARVNFRNTARIFKAIRTVTQALDYSLYLRRDTHTYDRLAALIARTASTNTAAAPWTEEAFETPKVYQLATSLDNEGLDFTHEVDIKNVTYTKPFGDLPNQPLGDNFLHSFRLTASQYKIGNLAASHYLLKIAEAINFCSLQEGAAVRGMLSLTKFVNRYYETSLNLKQAKDDYVSFESANEDSRVVSPKDVSKSQIESKLSYVNMMDQRIKDQIGGSPIYSINVGGYTYEEIRYLNILAKSFLRDLRERYEFEGVDSKTFYFYGMSPNQKYGSIISRSEDLGAYDYFVYQRRSTISGPRKHGVLLGIDYKGESGLEPGIKYKAKEGTIKYLDLDHKVTEPLVIRHMKEFLELPNTTRLGVKYDDIVESMPFFRITDAMEQMREESLYKWQERQAGSLFNYVKTYAELFNQGSVTQDVAFSLMKRKVDAFCLKYIMKLVGNVCFDERYLGLNTDDIALERVYAPQDLREEYFEPDNENLLIRQRPYDERFKRALRPTLERQENKPLAVMTKPVLDNSELIMAEIISNSNIARSYLDLSEPKFDDIQVVSFSSKDDLEVDLETSDENLLENVDGQENQVQLKSQYQSLEENGGLLVISPHSHLKFISE